MPRGGKNHAQGGGGESLRGGKISLAQDSIFLPPPWPILVVRPCSCACRTEKVRSQRLCIATPPLTFYIETTTAPSGTEIEIN